ncbi:hypothetical protein ABIB48_001615 [Arthrobacter sp. UYCu511]
MLSSTLLDALPVNETACQSELKGSAYRNTPWLPGS